MPVSILSRRGGGTLGPFVSEDFHEKSRVTGCCFINHFCDIQNISSFIFPSVFRHGGVRVKKNKHIGIPLILGIGDGGGGGVLVDIVTFCTSKKFLGIVLYCVVEFVSP